MDPSRALRQIVRGTRIRSWLKTWRVIDGHAGFRIAVRLIMISLAATNVAVSAQGAVTAEVSRVGDATHLEFRGQTKWNYDLKRVGTNLFELTLPSLDSASMVKLNTWRDSHLSRVRASRDDSTGQIRIIIEAADSEVESFDYLTDEPSRLIVDFYKLQREPKADQAKPQDREVEGAKTPGGLSSRPSQGSGAGPSKVRSSKADASSAPNTLTSDGYSKLGQGGAKRNPAGSEILSTQGATKSREAEATLGLAFDAADPQFKRFRIRDYEIKDDSIIASRNNIYIRFPTLKMPYSPIAEFESNRPEYVIQPKDFKENKEARLLLALYERHLKATDPRGDRIGAFMKVYDHFIKTYPDSQYDEIVKNIAAEMLELKYQRDKDEGDFKRSIDIFKFLVTRFPNSPLRERNQLWIAFRLASRGDSLGAIQEMQEYLRLYPKSEHRFAIQMAIADAYLNLSKYSAATTIYSEIAKNGETVREKVESAFRLGDVRMEAKDWPGAENLYLETIKRFPQGAKEFPNGYYNLGEARFQQRNFRNALDSYIQFVEHFPSHVFGGYAMTRIGECLDALGADRSRVIGTYLETTFRYPNHPGADIARIRMLSQQMRGMKDKELRKTLAEMAEIEKRSTLDRIGEFVSLLRADGFQRRHENEKALDELITYYQLHPTTADLNLFRARIHRNMVEVLMSNVESGNFSKSLAFANQYSKTWLNKSGRLDVPYLLGRSYELAGVPAEARRRYTEVLAQLQSLGGKAEIKERAVQELLPSESEIRLRLAAVAVGERNFPEAYSQLLAIPENQAMTDSESMEKTRLMAKVAVAQGQLEKARAYLAGAIESYKGDPEKARLTEVQLAEVLLALNRPGEAEKSLDKVLSAKQLGESITPDTYARALELKGDVQLAQKRDLAAIETYQKLIDEFVGQRPLGSVRYRVGEILFKKGDLTGAEKVWAGLTDDGDRALKLLAKSRIDGAKWDQDFRKYTSRIPAMAGEKLQKEGE